MCQAEQLDALRVRFQSEQEWHAFRAFVQIRHARGNAEELQLQWEIHQLQQFMQRQPWNARDFSYLPDAIDESR